MDLQFREASLAKGSMLLARNDIPGQPNMEFCDILSSALLHNLPMMRCPGAGMKLRDVPTTRCLPCIPRSIGPTWPRHWVKYELEMVVQNQPIQG
jgi:hypothetical protein